MSGAAAGLLVDAQGRVLLGRRSATQATYPLCWDAPGGHLEPGEDGAAALVRELREELGVRALAWTFLDTVAFAEAGGLLPCAVYAVPRWAGEVRVACDEHDRLGWFTPDEVARLPGLASPDYVALAARAVAVGRIAD